MSASREQLKKYRGGTENIPERLGLEMTFIVTNAMSVMVEGDALVFDSNAFSVTFETF